MYFVCTSKLWPTYEGRFKCITKRAQRGIYHLPLSKIISVFCVHAIKMKRLHGSQLNIKHFISSLIQQSSTPNVPLLIVFGVIIPMISKALVVEQTEQCKKAKSIFCFYSLCTTSWPLAVSRGVGRNVITLKWETFRQQFWTSVTFISKHVLLIAGCNVSSTDDSICVSSCHMTFCGWKIERPDNQQILRWNN